jgi:hypothetical protein
MKQYLTWSFLIKLIIGAVMMSVLEAIFGHINLALKIIIYVVYWAFADGLFPYKPTE